LQSGLVQEAGVTSLQPPVLRVRYFISFVVLFVYVGHFFARLFSSMKLIFGHFVFGSSCLADCITAGAGSECAVCDAKYAQTGNLLLGLACVLHDQLPACVCRSVFLPIQINYQFHS